MASTAGLRLEAEGAEEFKESLNSAAQAEKEFVEETKKTADALTNDWRRAFESFKAIGETAPTALANIQLAAEQGIKPSAILKQNLDLLFEAEQRIVGAGASWVELAKAKAEWSGKEAEALQKLRVEQQAQTAQSVAAQEATQQLNARIQQIISSGIAFGATAQEIKKGLMDIGLSATEANRALEQMGITAQGAGGSFERSREAAGNLGKAFFGLTLASFGLMSITKQLKEQGDTELLPTLEKITGVLQTVSSFGSAGAFIGGAPGAILGGAFGFLVDLPILTDRTSEGIKDLNQSLEQLGKKDEVIQTMAELAGVTEEQAEAALDGARNNAALRDALEGVARARRELENAPTGIAGTGEGIAGAAIKAVNEQRALAEANLITAESIVQIAIAQAAAQESAAKLGEEYQNIIDKLQTEDDLFQRTTGLTKEQTSEITRYADSHKGAGDALAETLRQLSELEQAQTRDIERERDLSMIIGEVEGKAKDQAAALLELALAEKEASNEADNLARAQQRLAAALQDAIFRSGQVAQRTQNQRDAAQQQYQNTIDDAGGTRANAIYNADQNLTNRIADLWQDLQNKVSDINQQLADRIVDIQTQLSTRIADIQQQLQDKIASIQQDLQNRLADLEHRRQEQVKEANDQIAKAAQDLARQLYEIERERIEATQALAFNTAEQLRGAQTDHDREAILRRHLFEQSQIDQEANDRRGDAQFDFQQKVEQAEKEKRLAQETFEYEVALAKRLAQQKIAEAQHAAEVQMEQARRQAAMQLAIAQREQAQALAAAERRYEQEKETAIRTYNQQVEAARRAEAEKLNDAMRALQQRMDSINKAAELERAQIEYTKQKAIEAYQEVIKHILFLQQAVAGLMAQVLELAGVPAFLAQTGANATANLFGDWIKNMQGAIPGGAQGLDMTVPNEGRYMNDGFLVRASAGERVVITAPNTYNSSSSAQSITFIINDATDPRRVAETVRRELATIAWN